MAIRVLILVASAALLLCHPASAESRDSIRTKRLVAAGKVWADIKYFHPRLAFDDIDWEAAWVEAYPRIHLAQDSAAYAKAIEEMLAVLGDRVTKVIHEPTPIEGGHGPIQMKWETGSVLAITFPHSGDFPGMIDTLRNAEAEIAKASAIVFDLRDASEEAPFVFSMSGISRMLSNAGYLRTW